jgi:hypothetical protein
MDYADLREAIYDQLCLIPALLDTGSPQKGKVFWAWTAPADTPKPYAFISFTGDVPSARTPCGMFVTFDVCVVGEEADILNLDPVADDVLDALHQVDIVTPKGRIIRCEYRRDARVDYWAEDIRANVIRLAFWLPTDFWI